MNAQRRYLIRTSVFPIILLLLALLPGFNFILFTLHGGLGWILMFLSGPFVLTRLAYGLFLKKFDRLSYRAGIGFFLGYAAVTYPLGALATKSIATVLGVTPSGNWVWAAMNMPCSLPWWPH
jgi:hypothetical protein